MSRSRPWRRLADAGATESEYPAAAELLDMPEDERDMRMSNMSELAETIEFEAFEAFGEEKV